MGILSTTVSMCQFHVTGPLPDKDLFEWASDRMEKFGFKPIDETLDEISIGWVHIDDVNASRFATPRDFFRENFITLTLRKDIRKIPKVVLQANVDDAEKEFLKANPGYHKVPKEKKEDLVQAIKGRLFSRVLPTPSTFDAVWDTERNILTLCTLSGQILETFMAHFRETFPDMQISLIHPYARAESVIQENLKEKLASLNQTSQSDTLSLIAENSWLGCDFLLWLMFQTMNGTSEYKVNQQGPLELNSDFQAFIDDKLLLIGEGDRGIQKITVAGPQSHFNEVKTALQDQKIIREATIILEAEEESWKMTLKGERFDFASFKTPAIKIEKDNLTDKNAEKEAVFYEKMFLLEKGVQIFESLYSSFLTERIGSNWKTREKEIKKWVEAA